MSAVSPVFTCVLDAGDAPPLPDFTSGEVRRRRSSWRRAAVAAGRPTTVVLDIGGVLVPTLFESVRSAGGGPSFPAGPLADDPAYAQVERGERGEREYWRALQDQGWDVTQLWRQCSSIRSLLWQALATASSRMRLVAFTNDMAHWFGPDWLARFPHLAQLDAIVEASTLGVSKPEPESFRRALAVIGERPENCLMVDDLQVNLEGAALVGMPTLHFDVRDPAASVAAFRRTLALPDVERPIVFRVSRS